MVQVFVALMALVLAACSSSSSDPSPNDDREVRLPDDDTVELSGGSGGSDADASVGSGGTSGDGSSGIGGASGMAGGAGSVGGSGGRPIGGQGGGAGIGGAGGGDTETCADLDCDDGDPCTDDSCLSQHVVCVNKPKAEVFNCTTEPPFVARCVPNTGMCEPTCGEEGLPCCAMDEEVCRPGLTCKQPPPGQLINPPKECMP